MEELTEIPSKQVFPIGEASKLCGVKEHVLRYWEQEFKELKPIKQRGNRRGYRAEDIIIARKIKNLLYDQGFTIKGAKQKLKTKPKKSSVLGFDDLMKELENVVSLLD